MEMSGSKETSGSKVNSETMGVPDGSDYNASDAEFMREMVPHHEMAVRMASAAYTTAKNHEVAAFAMKVLTTQRNEIDFMKQWLSARGLKPNKSNSSM